MANPKVTRASYSDFYGASQLPALKRKRKKPKKKPKKRLDKKKKK